jgi:anti-anti-sigma regulatory factor
MTLAPAHARTYRGLLVDLTNCSFIDATVTHALLTDAGRRRASRASLELVVPRDSSHVRRILEVTGAIEALPIHENRSAGLGALSSAERVARHDDRRDLYDVSARIDRLYRMTNAGRAADGESALQMIATRQPRVALLESTSWRS